MDTHQMARGSATGYVPFLFKTCQRYLLLSLLLDREGSRLLWIQKKSLLNLLLEKWETLFSLKNFCLRELSLPTCFLKSVKIWSISELCSPTMPLSILCYGNSSSLLRLFSEKRFVAMLNVSILYLLLFLGLYLGRYGTLARDCACALSNKATSTEGAFRTEYQEIF